MATIDDLPFSEILLYIQSDVAQYAPEYLPFYLAAKVHSLALYRGLCAAVTAFAVLPETDPLRRMRRVWFILPEFGTTVVCPTLFDLTQNIANIAVQREAGTDLRYTWWLPPNLNASGDARYNWSLGGETVHNLQTYCKYIRERGLAR